MSPGKDGAKPARPKVCDAKAPKMPEGIVFSTTRIARRKFDDDVISGMSDPIECEIVQHESVSSLPKEQHKVFLKFYGGGHVMVGLLS